RQPARGHSRREARLRTVPAAPLDAVPGHPRLLRPANDQRGRVSVVTTLTSRPNTALLVIDVQVGVVAEAHNRENVVSNIRTLVEQARGQDMPVIWVQHFDENLPRDSEASNLVPELDPGDAEPLVEKSFGDAFEDTQLESILADLAVGRLIVSGAQTDAC